MSLYQWQRWALGIDDATPPSLPLGRWWFGRDLLVTFSWLHGYPAARPRACYTQFCTFCPCLYVYSNTVEFCRNLFCWCTEQFILDLSMEKKLPSWVSTNLKVSSLNKSTYIWYQSGWFQWWTVTTNSVDKFWLSLLCTWFNDIDCIL